MSDCNCTDCQCKTDQTTEPATSAGSSFKSDNPGRDVQRVGTARFLRQSPGKIHDDVWAVTGSLGDSQCYLGVTQKVRAIQAALASRIHSENLNVRLIHPAYTIGVSDGQLNGTDNMRFSLIGREITNESIDLHLNASAVKGLISVVACDKPPVGTLAAILEHNEPAVILSDGSIRPGTDPNTHEPIDIVTAFQIAGDPDQATKDRVALNACCGLGSCGGMFTYNTMQTFIAVVGMEPLQMVSPASEDDRRLQDFPDILIDCLLTMTTKKIRPRDIVTAASIKNALTVAISMGGSTNVALHSVEIARAAGLDLWKDVISQKEFNALSRKVPVLVNARPFGAYSMVDIDDAGGLQVIVKELLDAGLLDGTTLTCTGETLQEQVTRLSPKAPDHKVIYSVNKPFKKTGGLRLLSGNLVPGGGAIIKVAGVEGGIENGLFTGRARVFNSERALIDALEQTPDIFEDNDMVVIRYAGPRGAPGMHELLDPTSRITALCRAKNITIALMTDARFSGGSVGVVIGHVGPETYLGGPIALIEDGDTIVIDLNTDQLDCTQLADPKTFAARTKVWQDATKKNHGTHPLVAPVTNRLLKRMRATARPALEGGGMAVDQELHEMKVQPYPYAFMGGKQVKIEDAKVSIMTNALQYGTGIFGGIRAYYREEDNAAYLFRLDDHFARFINSAKILGCPLPYTIGEFKDILVDLVKKNAPTGDAYLRIFGYVGNTELGPNLANTTLDFSIYMIALNEYMPLGKGLNVVVSSWRRVAETAIPTRAKISGAYVNSALARKEATDGGYDEAILLRENGLVSEGSAENIFIVRDGVLITPTASEGILEGMTRRSVMELAAEMGIPTEARPIEKSELYVADEVFLSGTACQVAWVSSIDKRPIGSGKIGPITGKLQDKFFGIVRGTDPAHSEWRTKITL